VINTRKRESNSPRQSCSSAIRLSINTEGDSPASDAGVFFGGRLVAGDAALDVGMDCSEGAWAK
jgi:hypothetical protein